MFYPTDKASNDVLIVVCKVLPTRSNTSTETHNGTTHELVLHVVHMTKIYSKAIMINC